MTCKFKRFQIEYDNYNIDIENDPKIYLPRTIDVVLINKILDVEPTKIIVGTTLTCRLNIAGIYIIRLDDISVPKHILYIGQSSNIGERILIHKKWINSINVKVDIIECSFTKYLQHTMLLELEKFLVYRLIKKFKVVDKNKCLIFNSILDDIRRTEYEKFNRRYPYSIIKKKPDKNQQTLIDA